MDDDRDRENELSSLSARPAVGELSGGRIVGGDWPQRVDYGAIAEASWNKQTEIRHRAGQSRSKTPNSESHQHEFSVYLISSQAIW